MAKRFSLREFALLTAPILAIGAVVLFASRQSKSNITPQLRLSIAEPTTLEAFEGISAALTVESLDDNTRYNKLICSNTALELQTSSGSAISHQYQSGKRMWGKEIWEKDSPSPLKYRYMLDARAISAGQLSFSFKGKLRDTKAIAPAPHTTVFVPVNGKWTLDRSKIRPPALASWPRKPLVSVREVTILRMYMPNKPQQPPTTRWGLTIEIVFALYDIGANETTPLELKFNEHHRISSTSDNSSHTYGLPQAPPTEPRRRILEWTATTDSPTQRLNVSGRASADNRWPLGFQVEPFNFQNAKVGQKLKFKQFPVALPKP